MPAQVISKKMRPTHRDIYVTIMDDYGVPMHVSLPVSLSKASRDAKIDAAIATLEAGQAAMEASALSEGIDLSSQKAEGASKRAAALKASGYVDPSLTAVPVAAPALIAADAPKLSPSSK